MPRFRITVRGESPQTELRGFIDGDLDRIAEFAEAMRPFGLVIYSPADGDYDPWKD